PVNVAEPALARRELCARAGVFAVAYIRSHRAGTNRGPVIAPGSCAVVVVFEGHGELVRRGVSEAAAQARAERGGSRDRWTIAAESEVAGRTSSRPLEKRHRGAAQKIGQVETGLRRLMLGARQDQLRLKIGPETLTENEQPAVARVGGPEV